MNVELQFNAISLGSAPTDRPAPILWAQSGRTVEARCVCEGGEPQLQQKLISTNNFLRNPNQKVLPTT